MEKNNVKILLNELEAFIKKFHLIKLLQSAIIGLSLIAISFLALAAISYFTYPSPVWKKIILIFYLAIIAWIIFEFIILKIIPLVNPNKRLTYRDAAIMIIKLNPEFDDKLLSLLDFARLGKNDPFIQAAINQKISKLKIWDIKNILTYREALKSVRILAFIIGFFLIVFTVNSDIVIYGTKKIINYNQYYQRPAPFKFILLNKRLNVLQDSSFTVRVKIDGKVIPENVFININGNNFLMPRDKKQNNIFYYTLDNIQEDKTFFFSAQNYNSKQYTLKVTAVPYIVSGQLTVIPPSYTGLKKQTFQNITQVEIPVFSKIKLDLTLKNTDSVLLIASNDTITHKVKHNSVEFHLLARSDMTLSIYLFHNRIKRKALIIKVKTNKDKPPYIQVEQTLDSLNYNIRYFMLRIKDDYGFSSLKFLIKTEDSTIKSYIIPIGKNKDQFLQFAYNFDSIAQIHPNIFYFFKICDNSKTPTALCTDSRVFLFKRPDANQITNKLDSIDSEIQEKADLAQNITRELLQLTQEYKQKSLTQNISEWEKQEMTKTLTQKAQELQQILDQLRQLNQEKTALLNSFSTPPEEITQKQELINQLLKQILNDDMKKLLEELQKLLNTKQASEQQTSYMPQFNKKLDQTLEFLKRLAIEQKTYEQTKAVKQLADQQDSLRNAFSNKTLSKQQAITKQQQISNKLKQTQESYNNLRKQNSTLKHPIALKDFSQNFQNIQKMMQQNQQLLNQGKIRRSNKLQQQIIDSLQKLSEQMSAQLQNAQMQSKSIDLQKIIQLIYRLEIISEKAENLINITSSLNYTNQSLNKILGITNNLEEMFTPVADSLFALGEKNIQIAKLIDNHIYDIQKNFKDIYIFVEKRNRLKLNNAEKNILDKTNTILLILTDIANNLNKQLNNAMPSMAQSQQQKSSMNSLSELQKMLEKQLQKLLQEAKQGKLSSKQLAKTLILKEKINFEVEKLLEQYSNSLDVAQKLKEIKRLNQMIEKQLLDKQLDNSLLQKASLMKVKLLDAENAIKTQNKKSNQRIAQHNFDKFKAPQLSIEQLKQLKNLNREQQILQNKVIRINNFYYQIFQSYSIKK